MNERTKGWMGGWIDGRMDRRMAGWQRDGLKFTEQVGSDDPLSTHV